MAALIVGTPEIFCVPASKRLGSGAKVVFCQLTDSIISPPETLVKAEKSAPVPYKEIVDLWNATTRKPKVCSLTEQRKRGMKLRYDELTKSGREPMEAFRTIFQKIRDNKFLREGNWCSFDWVFKNSNNLVKILEGNYDDKGKDNVNDFWDGRD